MAAAAGTKLKIQAVELQLAPGWSDTSVLSFLGPPENGVRANVLVTCEPLGGSSLEQFAKHHVSQLKRDLRKYTQHRAEARRLGNEPAFWLEHSFVNDGKVPVRQIQVMVARGADVYLITASHAEAQFEPARKALEAMIESLRLKA